MENKENIEKVENIEPLDNIETTENKEQQPTIELLDNTEKKQNENNNKNMKLIIIIAAIVLVIAAVVIGILALSKDDESANKKDNSKLAQKILTELDMDDFVASILTWETEVNKNLINPSIEEGIVHYLAASEKIEKYILIYENPTNTDMIYVKYNDFITKTKEIFNAEPTFEYKNTTMNFPNLIKNAEGKYETTLDNVGICNFASNTDNCYVLITASVVNNTSAEFSKLKMNGNTITGTAKKYYDNNDKDFFVDGNFEFKFDKNGNSYTIKSFKITKINAH